MSFRGLRLAVNTQTPLVRFHDRAVTTQADVPLAQLVEGTHYQTTTGGVTRMLLPLLAGWRASGHLRDAEWVASSGGDRAPSVLHRGLHLSFVGFPPSRLGGYAQAKERLWALLNANRGSPAAKDDLASTPLGDLEAYQAACAEALARARHRMGGLDALYVHDFQQLGVARAWPGRPPPSVFHLHTPFPSFLPDGWRTYILERLGRYDAVVVSTARYAENLRAAGHEGPVHVVAPFIDPDGYAKAGPREAEAFRERWGLRPGELVLLHVGRMDPMKGQDRLLRAFPHVLHKEPRARLVFVGNGSFSSAREGGLGLSKGAAWRAHLERLARRMRVGHRVVFTGHLDEEALSAAYEACDVFCLPSTREGFGLAVVEAWRHARPVVVSDRAGVAAHVEDGVNGRAVDAADPQLLAEALLDVLRSPEREAMGRRGLETSEMATLATGKRRLERVLSDVLMEGGRA